MHWHRRLIAGPLSFHVEFMVDKVKVREICLESSNSVNFHPAITDVIQS